jgi:hypothetical protein
MAELIILVKSVKYTLTALFRFVVVGSGDLFPGRKATSTWLAQNDRTLPTRSVCFHSVVLGHKGKFLFAYTCFSKQINTALRLSGRADYSTDKKSFSSTPVLIAVFTRTCRFKHISS